MLAVGYGATRWFNSTTRHSMFFVDVMRGDRRIGSHTCETMTQLAVAARNEFRRERADSFLVSVGPSHLAVMPYAWVMRDDDHGWIGGDGDSIRLGLEQNELKEHDVMDILCVDCAARRGFVSKVDEGNGLHRVVVHHSEHAKKTSAKSEGDLKAEAKKIADRIMKITGLK